MGAILTATQLEFTGLVSNGSGGFDTNAFKITRPFEFRTSHEVEVRQVTRKYDTFHRYTTRMRDPWRLIMSFLADASSGLPRIPQGQELTSVVITLVSGVTMGTGTGGTAIVKRCSLIGSNDGRPVVGSYDIQFSGEVTPNFYDSFITQA